jgi:hypothetical protein
MGSSGDGGGSTSKTTTTQALPTWLRPYAQGLAAQAGGLYGPGQQYPQQGVAGFSPAQQYGFTDTSALSYPVGSSLAAGQNTLNNLVGGLGLGGQAQGDLNAMMSGYGVGPAAGELNAMIAGGGTGPAQAQLQNIISGSYMDPSTNRYLQDYYNAAAAPVISNYQTAVAPNLLANAIGAGGLGSSGTASAFDTAQANLGTSLQDLASNMYEPAYQAGLSGMESAVGQGISQQQNAVQQGLGNQWNAVSTGLGNQMSGLGMLPGMATAQYTPAQQMLTIGGQQQQQAQNVLNTAFQNQMMPYQMLQQAAGLVGPISGNAGTTVSVGPNPQQSAK